MKIQKAIFSVSEPPEYSSYWNMQSRLYKQGLGIEPICLLFGKKEKTDMTEEFGKVIEVEPLPNVPWSLHMTFSKFDYTRQEPDTTWIIGDMDLLPLCRHHFVDNLAGVPDEDYVHLNAAGISVPRMGRHDGFLVYGSERHGKDKGYIGCDLPAHYHVAKGKHFESVYFQGRPLIDVLRYVVDSNRYGMGPVGGAKVTPESNAYWYYWVAEENYTSEQLWNAIQNKQVNFRPFQYCNANQRLFVWNGSDYKYNPSQVSSKGIVDIHCCQVRPYGLQKEALERIVNLTGLLT